jgi:hypothetical protein
MMSRLIDQRAQLDALLSSIEDATLDASDSDLYDDLETTPQTLQHLRGLIEAQLDTLGAPDPADVEVATKSIPATAAERRKMLLNLLAVRPMIPSTIRAAFTADREPTDDEVDRMIQKLLHLGLLGNGKSNKKR